MGDDLILELDEEDDLELELGDEDDLELNDGEPYFTNDYNGLLNKPQIEGVTLQGNKQLSDLIDFLVIDGHDAAWVTGEGAISHDND